MAVPKSKDAIALQQRFADNAVLLRTRANLSQVKTAERAGLHLSQISLLERGLRLPRLDTIVQLGGALNVVPCELLAGMAWRLGQTIRQPGAYVAPDTLEVGDAPDGRESP